MLDAQLRQGAGGQAARGQRAGDGIQTRARGLHRAAATGRGHVADPRIERFQPGIKIVALLVGDAAIAQIARLRAHQRRIIGLQPRTFDSRDPARGNLRIDALVEFALAVGDRDADVRFIFVAIGAIGDHLGQAGIALGQVLALLHGEAAVGAIARLELDEIIIDPMQAGSAMPLFRQTPRRTLHGELVVRLLPQDFCHCQR